MLVIPRRCISGILGVPVNKGQRRGGVEKGPETLRSHGLIQELQKFDPKIVDLGDLKVVDIPESQEPVGKIRRPVAVGRNTQNLSERIAKELKLNNFKPLINIGGDHSMAIGTISGTREFLGKCPAVLWVDAHADINPPELSLSGNLHGTPVSFLMKGVETKPLPGFEWLTKFMTGNDIAYIGLRDIDDTEFDIIKKCGILAFDMNDIDRLGIKEVLRQSMNKIDPKNDRQIHLSFDIDAIDPSLAPATGTPVRGGLFREEGEFICQELSKTKRLQSMDLVEVNPELSDAEGTARTSEIAISLIQHALGKRLKSEPHIRADPYVPEGSRNLL